jgi:SsrA-binding protein
MAKSKKQIKSLRPSFTNKKAYHDYMVMETLEAGIELLGSEVKAIRASRINLKESFIRIIQGELFLLGAHISHLETANVHYLPDVRRDRKLLVHKIQITKFASKVQIDGMTIVPLKLYFNQKNKIKLLIGLAKGKQVHDKREDLKRKTQNREIQKAIKERSYM